MCPAPEPVDVAANVARVRERIAQAAERSGRRPEDVRLVAAAKQVDVARVHRAVDAGVRDIGENYVQEAAAKRDEVVEDIRWHLIGHLQRNKAAQAVAIFDIIQSVDSLRIAEAIGRRVQAANRTVDVLIQVNTSGEATKSGVAPDDVERLVHSVAAVAGLRVQGLMTIGSFHPDPERGRTEFRLLRDIARRLESREGFEVKWLSMGMSHDFEVAIEEGASLVRIGTGIFGPRPS